MIGEFKGSMCPRSVDKSARIIGTYILAPNYMAVRTDQNQLALVQRRYFEIIDVDGPEWHAADRCRLDELGCGDRRWAKSE